MKRYLLGTFVLLLALIFGVTAAFAATITWAGNGTTGGYCNTLILDSSVSSRSQVWEFILTNSTSGSVLTYNFNGGPFVQSAVL